MSKEKNSGMNCPVCNFRWTLKSFATFEVWKKALSAHIQVMIPPTHLPQETPQTLAPPQQIHFPIDDKQSQIHLNSL